MGKKIVAFTPIKLNNERLKNKNILPLNNVPLLNYTINTVNELNIDNYIFCSTEKVKKYIKNDNYIFLNRDKKLDSNETIGYDIYKEFIKKVNADIYILYHVTSPLLKLKYLQKGIDKVISNEYDSALSVHKIKKFCWYKNKPLNYSTNNIIKTQNLNPIYEETSGFYIFTKDVFIKNKSRIGDNPYLVNVDFESSIDIDYIEEFELVQKCIKTQ
jgi:CMP-N-acetylneuraminic acid synthetase